MREPGVTESDPVPVAPAIPDPQAFVSDLIRRHSGDQDFSARAMLEQYPVLKAHRSCFIDLAYEEFCRLKESGRGVSPTEFAGQYREIEQSLHRVIEFDQILHDHPEFVESVPDDQWPRPGDVFCGFRLIEQIGRGVLSRVFVARQERLGNRPVVAKVCARGEQEASLLGQLTHSAIAAIHSIDTSPVSGLSVICMPYQTRATLHHVAELAHRADVVGPLTRSQIRKAVDRVNGIDPTLPTLEKPSPQQPTEESRPKESDEFAVLFADWGIALASALHVAHQLNILHCDVKPGNVLVLPDLSVQLLDFNLAAAATGPQSIIGGTLPYMAPEQLQQVIANSGTVTAISDLNPQIRSLAATDVFGLCATMWHLLSGQPPFGIAVDQSKRAEAALLLHSRQQRQLSAESIALAGDVVTPAVAAVLVRGMSFDANLRYQTADELALALRQASPRRTSARRAFRRRILIATFTLAVFGAALWVLGIRGRDPQARALAEASTHFKAGRDQQGVETLQRFLVTRPTDSMIAYELAASLIRQNQIQSALEVVIPFRSRESSYRMRYLDLYCQSLLARPCLEDATAPIVDESHRPVREEWERLTGEWQSLAMIPQIRQPAQINMAAMLLESRDWRNCGSLVNELQREVFDQFGRSRIWKSVVLHEVVIARGRARTLEIVHPDTPLADEFAAGLRAAGLPELGRTESQLMAISVAQALSEISDTEGAAFTEAATRLISLLERGLGHQLSPSDLRAVSFVWAIGRNSALWNRIASLSKQPCDQVDNRLQLLLIPPDELN